MISRWTLALAETGEKTRAKAKESLDGLKTAIKPVGEACDNCRKNYRLSQR